MLGAGLFSGNLGGKLFLVYLNLSSIMIVGAALGVSGGVIPGVELGIAVSVIAMGAILLAVGGRLSAKAWQVLQWHSHYSTVWLSPRYGNATWRSYG